MSEKLIIGGTTHICNDKLDFHFKRLKYWYETNSEHLESLMVPNGYDFLLKESDLGFWMASKSLKLDCNAIEALRYFHELLVEWVVNKWEADHGASIEVKDNDFPSNYTSRMIKFKNIDEPKVKEIVDGIKGFCPYEPTIRIEQLLEFPAFHSLKISALDNLPKAPIILTVKKIPKNIDQLYLMFINNDKCLKEWEKYYYQVSKVLSAITFADFKEVIGGSTLY